MSWGAVPLYPVGCVGGGGGSLGSLGAEGLESRVPQHMYLKMTPSLHWSF